MPLYHNEDQAMLAETASQFMAEEGAIAKQLRHWRDRECKDGFGHALWKQMAEIYPPYDEYQERAGERTIPVVVLDPVD